MSRMSAETGAAFGLLLGHLHATWMPVPAWTVIILAVGLAAIGAIEEGDGS